MNLQFFSRLLAVKTNRIKRDFCSRKIVVCVEQIIFRFGHPLFGKLEISVHTRASHLAGQWK